jgi:UDP-GlcNAc:undecaprenyl-phosphate/decaprenyl-phosphate GlcNAc-1-phosphate transferase
MAMQLGVYFITAFILAVIFTLAIKRTAEKFGVLDAPSGGRKVHKKPIPLMGGAAVFLSFFITLYLAGDILTSGNLSFSHWVGFFAGALVITIGGILDDKYNLKPRLQIIFPVLAAVCVIAGGVNIEKITNPMGGYVYLDAIRLSLFEFGGILYYFEVLSDLLIIAWLLAMMYSTKLLDGLDGLVTGVTAIGAFIIFIFTMTAAYFQPDLGAAALILAGSCLGFLVFNWHPAKIFLGEGGSLLAGYGLGVISIISGGKIAIALLVMGLPLLDMIWTIVRRLAAGKNPFKISDKLHLHFRLFDIGLGQRGTVLVYYLFSIIFGFSAVFLQSRQKLLALGSLIIIMAAIVAIFGYIDKKKVKDAL